MEVFCLCTQGMLWLNSPKSSGTSPRWREGHGLALDTPKSCCNWLTKDVPGRISLDISGHQCISSSRVISTRLTWHAYQHHAKSSVEGNKLGRNGWVNIIVVLLITQLINPGRRWVWIHCCTNWYSGNWGRTSAEPRPPLSACMITPF